MKNTIKGLLISLLMISGMASATHYYSPNGQLVVDTQTWVEFGNNGFYKKLGQAISDGKLTPEQVQDYINSGNANVTFTPSNYIDASQPYTVVTGDTFAKILYKAGLKKHMTIEQLDEINNFGDYAIYVGQVIYFNLTDRDDAITASASSDGGNVGSAVSTDSIGMLAASLGMSIEEFLILNAHLGDSIETGDVINYPSVELKAIIAHSPWYLEDGVYQAHLDGYTGSGITISNTNGSFGDGDHKSYDDHYGPYNINVQDTYPDYRGSDVIVGGIHTVTSPTPLVQETNDDGTLKYDPWGEPVWSTEDRTVTVYGIAKDATVSHHLTKVGYDNTREDLLSIADWTADVIHFATHRPIPDDLDGLNGYTYVDYLNDNVGSLIPEDSVIVINHGTITTRTDLSDFQLTMSDGSDGGTPTIDFRDQIIFVKAYTNHDANSLPNEGWVYVDRLLMDSGYIGSTLGGTKRFSTGAASSRVAGKIAILMSQHRSLGIDITGSEMADLVFVTSDKDEGTFYEWTSHDERTTVDYAAYKHGHGIFNLAAALNPVTEQDVIAAQAQFDANKCSPGYSTCPNEYTY